MAAHTTVHIHGDVFNHVEATGPVVLTCCHANLDDPDVNTADGSKRVDTDYDTSHVTYAKGDVTDLEVDELTKALMERLDQNWRGLAGKLCVPLYMVAEVEHQGASLYWKYSSILHTWVELGDKHNRQRLAEILAHNGMSDIAQRTLHTDS